MTEREVEVGLGLWSMRSTVFGASSWSCLYQQLVEDARLAEELGFESLWVAEHHFWYDGWCPQPLAAAASVLSATSRLRAGTAMYLLPQHDTDVAIRDVRTLLDLFGDRLDLGVSLGYRDEEYDGVGLARADRGERMEKGLARLVDELQDQWNSPIPVWVGGIAEPALRRAGRYGASLLLPNSLRPDEIAPRVDLAREESVAAGRPPGRVGLLVDVWITEADGEEVDRRLDAIVRHYREYAGAWFRLRGEPAFERPDLLDKQSRRTREAAVVGPAEEVRDRLLEIRQQGVDLFVLQVRTDVPPPEYRAVMSRLANEVLPALRTA